MLMDYFKNRTVVIASIHQKETVIAPILEKELGVHCITATHINTDNFGTFSGEVERQQSPLSTAKLKCLAALANTNYDIAIASEGSFGAHPSLYFVPADEEIIFLLDTKNEVEIVASVISTNTNFNGCVIHNFNELKDFAIKAKFPSHGLILKDAEKKFTHVIKGITNWSHLEQAYQQLSSNGNTVFAETDMRAMYNPSRMLVIKEATEKLISIAKSTCPNCNTPGFAVTNVIRGLPCFLCNNPTNTVKQLIYTCNKCNYSITKPANQDKNFEDPMYCNYCNP